jgi:hypothetical protein
MKIHATPCLVLVHGEDDILADFKFRNLPKLYGQHNMFDALPREEGIIT